MSKLDDIISSNELLRKAANAIGMKKDVIVPAELPQIDMQQSKSGTNSLGYYGKTSQDPMFGIPLSTQPTDLPEKIQAYRADPTNKFGKTGLESLPISFFDKGGNYMHPTNNDLETADSYNNSKKAIQEIYRMARINGAAEKHGYPAMSPEDLAAFALKEGRPDYGFNGGSLNNYTRKLNKELNSQFNIHPHDAAFLTTIADKKRLADKLGIPIAEAWNGTGKNELGQTGKDYANDWENHKRAALHEKNKELMNIINRGINDGKKHGFALKENQYKDAIATPQKVPYKKGGSVNMPKDYSDGNWKLI
jgi:hypothetical protein